MEITILMTKNRKISELARKHDIKIHLDGARLWNASIATGIPISEYCSLFDSVSLCFSKGLGAPVGSVLVGSRPFITKAKHFRKLYGGGWRQAGLLAEACHYSLDHILPNLSNDHALAQELASGLQRLGFKIPYKTETNMVWVDLAHKGWTGETLANALEPHGIRIPASKDTLVRIVFHHQISKDAVETILRVVENMI